MRDAHAESKERDNVSGVVIVGLDLFCVLLVVRGVLSWFRLTPGSGWDHLRTTATRVTGMLVGAIDSRAGKVVIHGWKTPIPISPEDAAKALEPFVGAFLYTHVDTEGMLTGLNLAAVKSVQAATKRRLIAAGGIKSRDEVDTLDKLGIDAVVGMAIYTGRMEIRP